MITLMIVYLASNPKIVQEAQQMCEFLTQRGLSCQLSGFIGDGPGAYDAVLAMACESPVIDAVILSAPHPRDSYVRGLTNTRKHIDAIRKFALREAAP